MCEQQFQAEVMDELKIADLVKVCPYFGNEAADWQLSCCGENHFDYVEREDE